MATSSLCCAICSENYKSTDDILVTKCGHVFHGSCYQDWQSRSTTCPNCRSVNQETQRIFLHIEDPTEVERRSLEEKVELVNKVSILEQKLAENEQNFFDIQQTLSFSEEQVNELNQQLELKSALNASYEQELIQIKSALEESEKNFMSTLEILKRTENQLNNRGQEIDFLKLQNHGREKKITDLRAEQEVCNRNSQEIHIMLQNKLKISQDEILKLHENMKELKIKSSHQQSVTSFENKNSAHEETIKRLESKLRQMSLELDKEIKLAMNLTVENMKLKSIVGLQGNENKQKIAAEYNEQRKNKSFDPTEALCNDLIDLFC